jgi:hypothetical protein
VSYFWNGGGEDVIKAKRLGAPEVLLALVLGLPWYFSFLVPWQSALIAHVLLAVGYLGLLLLFGKQSAIAKWMPFFLLSIACVVALRLQ